MRTNERSAGVPVPTAAAAVQENECNWRRVTGGEEKQTISPPRPRRDSSTCVQRRVAPQVVTV